MLTPYMNQHATLRRLQGYDDRGQPTHGSFSTVPCRKTTKGINSWSPDGHLYTTVTVWYLATEIGVDDLLDGLRVTSVEPMRGLSGEISGYKAVAE